MWTLAFSCYAKPRYDLVSIGKQWFSRNSINNQRYISKMACELLMQCHLVFGFLKCALPEDTIDVNLKDHSLKGIHTYIKCKWPNVALENWGPALPIITEEDDGIHEASANYNHSICQQTSPTWYQNLKLQWRNSTWYHLPDLSGVSFPNLEE